MGAVIAGMFVFVVAIVVGGFFLRSRRARERAAPPVADLMANTLDALASRLESDWHKEFDHRGADSGADGARGRPRMLNIDWIAAPPELADPHAARVVGSTADPRGLLETFLDLVPRRLVVIGPAGSGKSMLLILLLLKLCEERRRTPATPVPVLFSLSSYDPQREMFDWLADRLVADTPVPDRQVALALLERGLVLPLLDGLDEVPDARRPQVLTRIRKTFHAGLPVVVACRTEQYALALRNGPVLLNAAVTQACPPAFQHVLAYLRRSLQSGPGHADWQDLLDRLSHGWGVLEDLTADASRKTGAERPSWALLCEGAGLSGTASPAAEALWQSWSASVDAGTAECAADAVSPRLLAALGAALGSPLTASLFTELCRQPDMGTGFRVTVAWFAGTAPEDVRETVLDASVRIMFAHLGKPNSWDEPRTRRYLVFLARRLNRADTTDLAWWKLDDEVPHHVYGGLLGLLLGVAGGASTYAAVDDGRQAVAAGALFAVAGGATGLLLSRLGPSRVASLLDSGSPHNPRFSRMATALAVGLPIFGVVVLAGVLTDATPAGALLGGAILGLLFAIVAGLLGAGGPVRGPRWFRRGSGFWRSVGRGARTGLAGGVPVGLVIWVTMWAATSPEKSKAQADQMSSPTYGLAVVLLGCSLGLCLGALSGALNWMQVPASADDSLSPDSLLAGDRRVVVGWALGVACLPVLLAIAVFPPETKVPGIVVMAAIALWVPIGIRTWPRYVIALGYLVVRRQLPFDLMAFLRHAYDKHALRQVGGVYQFRHKDLQEVLGRDQDLVTAGSGGGTPAAHHPRIRRPA